MFTIRQILVRMREGDTDRSITRAGLMGRKKSGFCGNRHRKGAGWILRAVAREQFDGLKGRNLQAALAYRMRLTFQEIFTVQNRHQGASLLKEWMKLAKDSGLPPMVKVAYTIMNHWHGILRWFESHITNGILEGFNSLLQSAKSRARGYRTRKNFINMAYLILGKLDFQLPT
jgi:hypothetical protein